jgi:predicted small metal-binding protein
MSKQIKCECGFIARGESDESVVSAIEDHMRADHPDVLTGTDRQEIFGWIEQT